ncbi:MAG: cell wall metabolism sensor histidine kinase WalK [Armatimonadetes bacterium]|nr:cell wall metabolism sensor histidine kinase WalK [Armatimonadota bacterium]MDW8120726.1 PAS domain-containing sensor histidine kinase [Armatimonadota bacterium]
MSGTTEVALRAFLQEVVNTPLKAELLFFFLENSAADTAKGLAIWLGRSEEEISTAANELADAGVLRRDGAGLNAVYSFRPSESLRPLVQAFTEIYRSARFQLNQQLEEMRQQALSASEKLRALQWEQSRFRLVMTSMTNGILVLLPDKTISFINEAAARILGQTVGQVTGADLSAVDSPVVPLLSSALDEVFRPPHPALHREWTISDQLIVRANLVPVFDEEGTFLGAVAVLTDVTADKTLERQRGEMLTVLAHDIKSPITAIRGFALSGVRGMLGELPPKGQRALEVIVQQTDRIQQMIQQMTRLIADIRGVPPLKPVRFNLTECLQSLAGHYEGHCSERNLTLRLELSETPVWVQADREMIERVFANLISNAIKYNRDDGQVIIRVQQDGESAVVEVEDTGVGIPGSELPFIFWQYYRASTAIGEGSGVGLSFVKQVVEAHGGRIEVNSIVGQGSLFRVVLPVSQTGASGSF